MTDIYSMKLTPRYFRLTIAGQTAEIDPLEANAKIAEIQTDQPPEGVSAAIRDWVRTLFDPPPDIDINSAVEFADVIITTAAEMVAQRKKKLLPTVNSLLSSLGFREISANGRKSPGKRGSKTSPQLKQSGRRTKTDSGSTPTTALRTPRKKSPARKKKATKQE